MATDQEMLDAYINAEQAILAGKSYTIGGRTVQMEDLQWIQAGRREYERKVSAASAGSSTGGGAAIATWNPNAISTRFSNRNCR